MKINGWSDVNMFIKFDSVSIFNRDCTPIHLITIQQSKIQEAEYDFSDQVFFVRFVTIYGSELYKLFLLINYTNKYYITLCNHVSSQ